MHESDQQLAGIFLLLIFGTANAQDATDDFPNEARERLDYTIGKWRSEGQFLDSDNNVTRTVVTETDRRYAIGDRVVAIEGVTVASGEKFLAWEYYDTNTRKYTLTGINAAGSLFTMDGELGERFIWESEPRAGADGRMTAIRFEHVDITADSFTAVGSISHDGGETWRVYLKQYLTRLPDQ